LRHSALILFLFIIPVSFFSSLTLLLSWLHLDHTYDLCFNLMHFLIIVPIIFFSSNKRLTTTASFLFMKGFFYFFIGYKFHICLLISVHLLRQCCSVTKNIVLALIFRKLNRIVQMFFPSNRASIFKFTWNTFLKVFKLTKFHINIIIKNYSIKLNYLHLQKNSLLPTLKRGALSLRVPHLELYPLLKVGNEFFL
jgi:hypothetical protein